MYKVTIETGEHPTKSHPLAPALLSELYIHLPKPQPTPRKLTLHPEHEQHEEHPRTQEIDTLAPKPVENGHKTESNCYIFSGTRTKNSSASLPGRSESEIITEWVRNLFQKRGLLGPLWEQKLQRKRREILRSAFTLITESARDPSSAYLQTQSKYKPYVGRTNQLLGLGLQKLAQLLPRMIARHTQKAFSKILRFLAFQHVSSKLRLSRQPESVVGQGLGLSGRNSLKSSRNRVEQVPIQVEYCSPVRQLKAVQSLRHISFQHNEYALAPVSPLCGQEVVREEKGRSSQKVPLVLRNSTDLGFVGQRQQLPVEYNQQMLSPRTPEKGQPCSIRNSHHFYVNPPSPTSRQINNPKPTLAFAPPPVASNGQRMGNAMGAPQMVCVGNAPPVRNMIHFSNTESIRSSTHIRPHSHNPYVAKSSQKEGNNFNCQTEQEQADNGRSRAVSATANIKISFIATGSNGERGNVQMVPVAKVRDYEGEAQLKMSNNMYKLGTLQNKLMRQSYQANSFQNELMAHDMPRSVHSPSNGVYSSPTSPKVIHFPASPVQAPYQQQYREGSGRTAVRVEPNEYNMRRREKLVVTTSSKRRH